MDYVTEREGDIDVKSLHFNFIEKSLIIQVSLSKRMFK